MRARTLPSALIATATALSLLPVPAATAAGAGSVASAVLVAKLTGPGSINQTDSRYHLKATDLGIMWDNGSGEVLTAFGDTFGDGWAGPGGGVGDGPTIDWRSNTLARSNDVNLSDGMTFTSVVQDRAGHAGELLGSKKMDNDEMTVIPTAGVSVGARSYLHYMSVRHWGDPGRWLTNYSGVAYSDDDGQSWYKDPNTRWKNDAAGSDNFQMAAYAKADGYVYMFGTPNGRFGDVRLARVRQDEMLSLGAYEYWNGTGWEGQESAAVPVVPAPVSELSVHYDTFLGKWLMMYLADNGSGIVLRTSSALTGPWSGERQVVSSAAYPGLYGGFIHPWSARLGGPDLYFTMSQWNPYNVFLMRTTVSP